MSKSKELDSDAEPRQRDRRRWWLQSCGGWRSLQPDRVTGEEGESQTVITRQHEVLSNTLQGGNSERVERSQRQKENRGYTNRTDHSPQPTNTARVQLPHTLTDLLQPGDITAPSGSVSPPHASECVKCVRVKANHASIKTIAALYVKVFYLRSFPAS